MRGHAIVVAVLLCLLCSARAPCPRTEWVDPDTPAAACDRKTDFQGEPLELVFSDEFEVAGRTFADGDDPMWTALTGYPSTNNQINAYTDEPEYAMTAHGKLRLMATRTQSNLDYGAGQATRQFSTPMLQGWNKFCFQEGLLEISAQLPGNSYQPGLWPAGWVFGNLGRATLKDTTERTWPFSYNHCPDAADDEANQDIRMQQKINACLGPEWTRQYGLNPHQGRGAIEIDIIEAMPGTIRFDYKGYKIDSGFCKPLSEQELENIQVQLPMVATSLQLAPGIPQWSDQRPDEFRAGDAANCYPEDWATQWYHELEPGNRTTYGTVYNSTINIDFYGEFFALPPDGVQTDAVSAISALSDKHYIEQHVYQCEWRAGSNGYMRFSLDDLTQFYVDAALVEREHNITRNGTAVGVMKGRQIPQEPSYVTLNIDLSTRWGWVECDPTVCNCCNECRPECTTCHSKRLDGSVDTTVNHRAWLQKLCDDLPGFYEIDYVRVYQRPGATRIGCNPADHPTEGWIQSHYQKYVLHSRDEPLRPVFAGGADCTASAECGAPTRGACADGVCACDAGWTGPRCLTRRVGAAARCRALEDVVVGGGRCYATATACGAARGRGACAALPRNNPWERPVQYAALPDGGWKRLGGADGRCECAAGWGGPYCTRPLPPSHCVPSLLPPVNQLGKDLEVWISVLCQTVNGTAQTSALAQACSEVCWKPHWESGGGYSQCGAWPRVYWIAVAHCRDNGGRPGVSTPDSITDLAGDATLSGDAVLSGQINGGGHALTVNGRVWINSSLTVAQTTLNWEPATSVTIGSGLALVGATVNSRGTTTVTSSGAATGDATSAWNNAGTLVVSAGVTWSLGLPATNTGVIIVEQLATLVMADTLDCDTGTLVLSGTRSYFHLRASRALLRSVGGNGVLETYQDSQLEFANAAVDVAVWVYGALPAASGRQLLSQTTTVSGTGTVAYLLTVATGQVTVDCALEPMVITTYLRLHSTAELWFMNVDPTASALSVGTELRIFTASISVVLKTGYQPMPNDTVTLVTYGSIAKDHALSNQTLQVTGTSAGVVGTLLVLPQELRLAFVTQSHSTIDTSPSPSPSPTAFVREASGRLSWWLIMVIVLAGLLFVVTCGMLICLKYRGRSDSATERSRKPSYSTTERTERRRRSYRGSADSASHAGSMAPSVRRSHEFRRSADFRRGSTTPAALAAFRMPANGQGCESPEPRSPLTPATGDTFLSAPSARTGRLSFSFGSPAGSGAVSSAPSTPAEPNLRRSVVSFAGFKTFWPPENTAAPAKADRSDETEKAALR